MEESSDTQTAPTSPRRDAATDPFEQSGETLRVQHAGLHCKLFTDNLIKKDDLKDLLECPVCLRVPRSSPIYQCARGHVVCSECRPNVTTCPQCRDPLGNIRSLISEKMLEKLPCVCKYTDHGCNVSLALRLKAFLVVEFPGIIAMVMLCTIEWKVRFANLSGNIKVSSGESWTKQSHSAGSSTFSVG